MIATIDSASLDIAKWELALRKRRNASLGADLFGEPAWDMLLELFVAAGEERPVTATELRGRSGLPDGTADRWLRTLERQGRVSRVADPSTGDREFVTLAPAESGRMTKLLDPGA